VTITQTQWQCPGIPEVRLRASACEPRVVRHKLQLFPRVGPIIGFNPIRPKQESGLSVASCASGYSRAQPMVGFGVSSADVYIENVVRCNLKMLVAISLGMLGATATLAIVPDQTKDQYQTIPERNVFGLRPPQAQAPPANASAPLPKITLTGITTILDSKRALMKVAPSGGKQVDPAKELSLILTEGQREGDIEVLQIDERAGSVKVNNSGTVMLLTFEKDGAKLPATAPVPGAPGTAAVPTALPTTPVSNSLALPAQNGISNTLPSRTHRFSTPPLPGVAAVNNTSTVPVGGIPTPTGAVPAQAALPNGGQDLTPEEQAIIIELQRQANVNNSALLPPTAVTPNPAAAQPAATAPAQTGANVPVPGRPMVLVPQ